MIAIIDVSGNNLTSLGNALKQLGYSYQFTHDEEEILKASHVIIPGVGAAPAGMQALQEYQLISAIKQLKQPTLGICLGMQLLAEFSEEGDVDCLGLIPGIVKRLPQAPHCPVPHMGWNTLEWVKQSSLNTGLKEKDYVYFVHSYAFLSDSSHALAYCDYSTKFTAIIQYKNFYGMQFHPEKSASVGLVLLRNFLEIESSIVPIGALNETYSCD
ncbi:imidazole glycerol phosphate synthase subunit HisH [Legionella beliardensis]|uniref:Imidazole glycerol phosphate synthase subunit HisH n=1 Tax=Legionella beliardensis TaxID=91822 RepID=A0A378I2U7_9GAMM|nr:imidazole glycerol phosphate synthase subunit HisH [Legionella beliardensis]STX29313.1 imidazole glycerol phosphate synthase subunit HisH [Legionella beliardensis]